MKEQTVNALDMFIQQLTKAVKVAIPDAVETVKGVEVAAKDLRDALIEEL